MMESSGILAELLKQTALGVYLIRSKKPPFGYCDIHLNVRLNQAYTHKHMSLTRLS